jgi:hypothetical protein
MCGRVGQARGSSPALHAGYAQSLPRMTAPPCTPAHACVRAGLLDHRPWAQRLLGRAQLFWAAVVSSPPARHVVSLLPILHRLNLQ